METSFWLKIPVPLQRLLNMLGQPAKRAKQIRRQRRLQRTLEQMPEWQRKDLNLNVRDLRDYRHYL